jgi:pectate lyase
MRTFLTQTTHRALSIAAALLFALAMMAFSGVSTTLAAPVDQLVGYGAGTTGGAGGSTVTVTSLSAFTTAVSGSTATIVKVSGILSGTGQVKVGSNKTILGVGSNSGFSGVGLDLDAVSNVIIRNLKISKVVGTDAITIIRKTNHVWVDHNDLSSDLSHGKDYYDGLLDITRQSDYITVSWNRFHDHYKVSLIGHSDSFTDDKGYLHVTYHHNWFYNVNSRMPSLRFGTGHIYNNYYQNVTDSAVHSRMGAQTLIQNNVFGSTDTAITTTGDSSSDGYANASGNDYGGATVTITQVGSFTSAPYSFSLDAASAVASSVTASSGVGIVG